MSQSDVSLAKSQSFSEAGILYKFFLEHPHEANEKYAEHLLFTIKIAGYLVATSLCLVIHGLLPRFHQTTTSRRILELNMLFQSRCRK